MNRLRAGMIVLSVAAAVLLIGATGVRAEETLSAKLDPSGLVRVVAGEVAVEVATVDLNAHGPGWKHAPQAGATARVSDLPDQAGKRVVGVLPVPGTDGGALEFTETVKTLPQGFRLEYEVGVNQAMKLNGLQVSILLPVARYAGKELVITRPDDDEPSVATLPLEQREETPQVWAGAGSKIEVATGTDQAITIELLAAADIVIQDLRKWDQPVFEIRFPAIMEDPGRVVAAEDKFHLNLTVTFAGPVKLTGP